MKHFEAFLQRLLAVFVLALTLSMPAHAQQGSRFDHFLTGFPLSGAHLGVECTSCHVNGRFKGTPRQCASCHNGSTAPGKTAGHPPTSSVCEGCHITSTWAQVRYDHSLAIGPCVGCHNGSHAQGKPANHISTTQPCEACGRLFYGAFTLEIILRIFATEH